MFDTTTTTSKGLTPDGYSTVHPLFTCYLGKSRGKFPKVGLYSIMILVLRVLPKYFPYGMRVLVLVENSLGRVSWVSVEGFPKIFFDFLYKKVLGLQNHQTFCRTLNRPFLRNLEIDTTLYPYSSPPDSHVDHTFYLSCHSHYSYSSINGFSFKLREDEDDLSSCSLNLLCVVTS